MMEVDEMLTSRQLKILTILTSQEEVFITGGQIAFEVNVSSKTVQSEIKILREILEENGASIIVNTHRGYCFELINKELFKSFYSENYEYENQMSRLDEPLVRHVFVLKTILFSPNKLSLNSLADICSLSKARMLHDLKEIKKSLEKYKIDLIIQDNYVQIVGAEKDKRRCIIQEKIPFYLNQHSNWVLEISDIAIEVLSKNRYKIADFVLQNLVMHLILSIQRMQQHNYVSLGSSIDLKQIPAHERNMSIALLEKLAGKYHFEWTDDEANLLAINLQGKRDYDNQQIITEKTDVLVNELLEEIKVKIKMDLTYDVELRISLALHILPLLTRMKHNMQLNNAMNEQIKQYFILAYDLAVFTAAYLKGLTNQDLSEGEIGFIAVHFNVALLKKSYVMKPKKILIICSSRSGDSLLLKHKLFRRFNEMIDAIEVKNELEWAKNTEKQYDVVFSTLESKNYPNAIKINYFLEHRDYQIIEKALLEVNQKDELLQYFEPQLFVRLPNIINKNDLLKMMCEKVILLNHESEDLLLSVMNREMLGYTAYGNLVAIPHPDGLVCEKTCISVAILKFPIDWQDYKVQIVLLVCAAKNEEKKLYSIYEAISKLMVDKSAVNQILKNPEFNNFINIMNGLLE